MYTEACLKIKGGRGGVLTGSGSRTYATSSRFHDAKMPVKIGVCFLVTA